MDPINGIDNKSNLNKVVGINTPGISAASSFRAENKKPETGSDTGAISDSSRINSKDILSSLTKSQEKLNQVLEDYRKNRDSVSKLRSAINKHFKLLGPGDRPELLEHLFSSDNEIKSLIAANFAKLNPESSDYTKLDEAARNKALMSARENLKKGISSKTSADHWFSTLGRMGEKKDLDTLLSSARKMEESEIKESIFLKQSLINSYNEMIKRHPNALDREKSREAIPLLLDGLDSRSSTVRKKSVQAVISSSQSWDFIENFTREISKLPRNKNTARSMGLLAENLLSNRAEQVTFTSLILDKSMKGAKPEFKKQVLQEATGVLNKFSPSKDHETVRDATSVLGKHFVDLLKRKKEKKEFESKSSEEKLKYMIKYFHG